MPEARRIQLDELVNRPGTYFNPLTEMLLVVDDSPHLDTEIFAEETFEAEDWLLISDEMPLDEHLRDQLLERFQIRHEAGAADEEDEDANEELEPDPEED